jgi:hypothetical protein
MVSTAEAQWMPPGAWLDLVPISALYYQHSSLRSALRPSLLPSLLSTAPILRSALLAVSALSPAAISAALIALSLLSALHRLVTNIAVSNANTSLRSLPSCNRDIVANTSLVSVSWHHYAAVSVPVS